MMKVIVDEIEAKDIVPSFSFSPFPLYWICNSKQNKETSMDPLWYKFGR